MYREARRLSPSLENTTIYFQHFQAFGIGVRDPSLQPASAEFGVGENQGGRWQISLSQARKGERER